MDEMMDTRRINEKRDGGTRSGDETSERAMTVYETRSDECSHMILPFRLFFHEAVPHFLIEHENKNTARAVSSFYLSPDPLLRALSNPQALNVPPPPGRGMCGCRSICGERAVGCLVRLFPRTVPLSHYVRSLFLVGLRAG